MVPRLPADLLARARSLREVGVSELAWSRADAFEVLRAFETPERAEVGILGGDVWRMREDGPSPAYDNWCCNRRADEPPAAFAQRSRAKALQYLHRYVAPFIEEPRFVLVLTQRGLLLPP